MHKVIEAPTPGYTYLRGEFGVLPYAHLVASASTRGVTALCGRSGSKAPNWRDDEMIRCVECVLAQQLL